MPSDRAELDQLLQTTRTWLELTPHATDLELARVVWAFHWRVPFPQSDHPATAQALDLLYRVIAVARAEQPEPAANDTPALAAGPAAQATVVPISETPTPGCFYHVRPHDDLLGTAGIAAQALSEAAMDAARRKGWPAPRAESRAKRLSSKTKAQATYTELICRGEWNSQQHAREPTDGALLWLPPLCERRLLDPSQSRRVRVDPRPWSDGTSRLEPPPALRGLPSLRLFRTIGGERIEFVEQHPDQAGPEHHILGDAVAQQVPPTIRSHAC